MSAIELFEAAKHGNAFQAKTALRNGADVAARDKDGSTPLHVAARVSEAYHRADPMATVAALIEAGADPGARDEDGKTPFNYAKEHNGASWEDGAYWRLSEARFA